jgi:hypothetical protein
LIRNLIGIIDEVTRISPHKNILGIVIAGTGEKGFRMELIPMNFQAFEK